MARVGQEGELSVEEDDGVAAREEVLGGSGAAGTGGEVVDEADGLVLEGDDGAAGGDEDDAAVGGAVEGKEGLERGGDGGEVFWGGVGFEVDVGFVGGHVDARW